MTEHLSRQEVECAYRRLCASMVAQSAFVLAENRRRRPKNKWDIQSGAEVARQRAAARHWIDGGEAVVPFSEACAILNLEEDATREAIARFETNPDLSIQRRWRNAAYRRPRPITSESGGTEETAACAMPGRDG